MHYFKKRISYYTTHAFLKHTPHLHLRKRENQKTRKRTMCVANGNKERHIPNLQPMPDTSHICIKTYENHLGTTSIFNPTKRTPCMRKL